MLALYSLPGRLIAELWYFWPKKGQVWASGRRRGHPFVHFLYATLFYAAAWFWVVPALLHSGPASSKQSAAEQVMATSNVDLRHEPAAGEATVEDGLEREPRDNAPAVQPPEVEQHSETNIQKHEAAPGAYPKCSAAVTDGCQQ